MSGFRDRELPPERHGREAARIPGPGDHRGPSRGFLRRGGGRAGRRLRRLPRRSVPQAGRAGAVGGGPAYPGAQPHARNHREDPPEVAGDHLRLLQQPRRPRFAQAAQEPVDQRGFQRPQQEHGGRPDGTHPEQPGESGLRPGAETVAADRVKPRHRLARGHVPGGVAVDVLRRREPALHARVRHLRRQSPAVRRPVGPVAAMGLHEAGPKSGCRRRRVDPAVPCRQLRRGGGPARLGVSQARAAGL